MGWAWPSCSLWSAIMGEVFRWKAKREWAHRFTSVFLSNHCKLRLRLLQFLLCKRAFRRRLNRLTRSLHPFGWCGAIAGARARRDSGGVTRGHHRWIRVVLASERRASEPRALGDKRRRP